MANAKYSLFSKIVPSDEVKEQIVRGFWPQSRARVDEFASYFRNFQYVLELLPYPAAFIDKTEFAIQNFDDLICMAQSMNKYRNEDRQKTTLALQRDHFPEANLMQIVRSMELVACLWLTLSVDSRDVSVGKLVGSWHICEWDEAATLVDIARRPFRKCSYSPNIREARISSDFIAVQIQNKCGIRLEWTSNLADHLLYDPSPPPRAWWQWWLAFSPCRGILYIYPHSACLYNHWQHNDVYPKELMNETLKTLDLLFPFGNADSRAFLQARNQPFFATHLSSMPRTFDLGDFDYWRARLVDLYDAFNAPPFGFYQMWHDRRNPMQWWTFWLATLILILSVVFGTISVYTAFEQTALARESYQLALRQACDQKHDDVIAKLCLK
jgi:hypothetical protein